MDTKLRYYPACENSLLRLGLIVILLLFLIPVSYSQNTKGDKPTVKGGTKRESRFRLSSKKKLKDKKPYNRVQGRRPTQANRASSSKPTKLYSQKGRFVNNRSVTTKISRQNLRARSITYSQSVSSQQSRRNSSSPRVRARSATGRTRNVYPQRGRYVNNPSRKPKSVERPVSNRQELARIKRISHQPDPPKRRRVTPASASRSYISRRSINAFAGFWNKKPKGEKAYVGDISGRRLRTKNFETKRPVITNPTANPYRPKKRIGDRPYKGQVGGYVSATRSGKAWRGDVAGRKIRGKNFSSKRTIEGKGRPVFPPRKSKIRVGDRPYKGAIPGGGNISVSGKISKGKNPVPGKVPGIGAKGIDTFQGNTKGGKAFNPQGEGYTGNLKARRPLKGGGSVSGKRWNNKGVPIPVRTPSNAGAYWVGKFQGTMKAQRPLKGGGSVSGKRWNNQGLPIPVRTPGAVADRIGTFQGNIKAHRPLKGGGSVSGRLWNNKGTPIPVRTPGAVADRIGTFQGNIKAHKPLKGGGSVSGKLWNNKGVPIPVRTPGAVADRIGTFQGNIKAHKPLKGGGSVSGKLWNNKEQPIQGKAPKGIGFDTYQGNIKVTKKEPSKEIGGFPGKYHEFDLHPSVRNQGEEFTGFIRLPRFKKQYIKNPNAAEEAQKKNRPDKSTYLVDGLQVKVKQQEYKKRPNAAEGSMLGIGPGKNSIKASEFSKAMRLNWNYKHNPNSADEALNTREPGKAFARATNYQGNIKMKKFEFFGKKEFHPDSKFVKINKNNTDEERSMLTNFKLWWARLFKKSDTQPDHLKEKYRKPRYDKREDGLWAD